MNDYVNLNERVNVHLLGIYYLIWFHALIKVDDLEKLNANMMKALRNKIHPVLSLTPNP